MKIITPNRVVVLISTLASFQMQIRIHLFMLLCTLITYVEVNCFFN